MTCHRLALSTLPPRSGRINSPGLFSLSRSPSTNADRRTELMATPADGLAGELPPNTSGKLANPTSIRNVNSLVSLSLMTFCLPRPSDRETPDRAARRSAPTRSEVTPIPIRLPADGGQVNGSEDPCGLAARGIVRRGGAAGKRAASDQSAATPLLDIPELLRT